LEVFADFGSSRYLLNNLDWLDEELGSYEDDYVIIDCPGKPSTVQTRICDLTSAFSGQIELYTHIPLLPRLVSHLANSSLQFRVSAVYLLESQFIQADKPKFFAGVMSAMSCMMSLGCSMICLMSKMDLIKNSGGGTGKGIRGQHKIGKEIGRYLDPDPMLLLEDINQETNPKFHALNQAVVDLVCLPATAPVNLVCSY
jgi:hypothetical protein